MGNCILCPAELPDDELLDHLRVIHPIEYGDGVLRFPDGLPLIMDDDIDPGEAGG